MIENDDQMRPELRRPTYDGSLWGPNVCRCGSHVDPHIHPFPGALGVSIYEQPEGDSNWAVTTAVLVCCALAVAVLAAAAYWWLH